MIDATISPQDALLIAIRRAEGARRFYEDAAAIVLSPHAREALATLGREEADRAEVLTRRLRQQTVEEDV
jgi:rubrerythrin